MRRPAALVGAAAVAAGCAGDPGEPPVALADGSPVRSAPIVLEGVDAAVIATRARALDSGAIRVGSPAHACSAAFGADPDVSVVERVGAHGVSVTFVDGGRRTAHACDAREAGSWCGWVAGRFESGRLRDPHATLSCRSADGGPVGFAWVEPDARTAHVVVHHGDFAEIYRIVGALPVRVASLDVELESATATFAISEHARDGSRLRAYDLEAQVAG